MEEIKKWDYVFHKSKSLGIGVVVKVSKKSVVVKFQDDIMVVAPPAKMQKVNLPDERPAPVKFSDLKRQTASNTVEHEKVIVGNEVQAYVGIGWHTINIVEYDDFSKYPIIYDG